MLHLFRACTIVVFSKGASIPLEHGRYEDDAKLLVPKFNYLVTDADQTLAFDFSLDDLLFDHPRSLLNLGQPGFERFASNFRPAAQKIEQFCSSTLALCALLLSLIGAYGFCFFECPLKESTL